MIWNGFKTAARQHLLYLIQDIQKQQKQFVAVVWHYFLKGSMNDTVIYLHIRLSTTRRPMIRAKGKNDNLCIADNGLQLFKEWSDQIPMNVKHRHSLSRAWILAWWLWPEVHYREVVSSNPDLVYKTDDISH